MYEKLGSEGSMNLIGSDKDCTGLNDTSMSKQYYARGKGVEKPSTTSTSVTSTAKSMTETIATASSTPSALPSEAAAPPKGNNGPSAKHQVSLKSMFLVGIVFAPLLGLLV